jgi:hypothetical protein
VENNKFGEGRCRDEVSAVPFEDVYLINDRLSLASERDVENAQRDMCINFPKGYREFVMTLGAGVYCGTIYIALPVGVVRSTPENRETLRKHYYWEDAKDVLSKRQVLEAICLGRSDCGDTFVYRQLPPSGIFVLDDCGEIHQAGSDLYKALDWLSEHVGFVPPARFRYFDSLADEAMIEFLGFPEGLSVGELRNRLLALRIHERVLRDKNGIFEMAVKRIQGRVYCHQGRLAVYYDRTCNPDALGSIVRKAEECGLSRISRGT